ncbi:alpha/beta fold hydrolase [Pseudothioclava nitratireducens]|uniref:alpha/beta fold hydrolase n=1 Tax=Pseudothioclava nitratireducens TaxID=1928646 RepID=UPI0023DCAEEF|nr:alpha/beta fold hydrolase [Defluviimonas nitratireducens]MDF1621033.1 alpha/beta fold hydrolase [Defluviimonas nitratireducens]
MRYLPAMWLRALGFLFLSGLPAQADCTVLLHGLARSPNSLLLMETALKARGGSVINAGYPSTEAGLGTLVGYIDPAVASCGEVDRIDFVTHSMGGILVQLWALSHPERMGRVVMLAPPNGGSEIVDIFGEQAWFEWFNGPAGVRLGTSSEDIPAQLPEVTFDLGVIAGNQTVNPITSAMIEGTDDGKVSVENTRIAGMSDHITLPVTHTWMMNDPRVIVETIAFLDSGAFVPEMSWGAAFKALTTR